jgi:ABC-type bacteriocin/lantibiotic exporter with double-glycine peptidase domain
MKLNVPFYRQEHEHTCVPACPRMVLEFFGTALTEDDLARRCSTTVLGTGRVELSRAAT